MTRLIKIWDPVALRDSLLYVIRAMGTVYLPKWHCVYFGGGRVTSTNGRLVHSAPGPQLEFPVNIYGKIAQALIRLLKDEKENIRFLCSMDGLNIEAESGWEINIPSYGHNFPPYDQLSAGEHIKIMVDTRGTKAILSNMLDYDVKCTIDGNDKLVLSDSNGLSMFVAFKWLSPHRGWEGVTFPARALKMALGNVKGSWEHTTALSFGKTNIEPLKVEFDDKWAIIMPVRVQND